MTEPQKIIRLEASNFKRLRAVEIKPDGSLVVIRGKNGAGKSSVLDAIQSALGGKRLSPAKPVRDGEELAEIVTELDGLTIRRTFRADGGGSLVVEAADGSRVKSPQAVLDKLVGSLSFDPLAFARLDPGKRLEIVRDVAGVDVGPLDGKRANLFEERTEINRAARRLEGQLAGLPAHDPMAPDEAISVSKIADELEAAQGAHAEQSRLTRESDTAGANVAAVERSRDVLEERISALQEQLGTLEGQREGLFDDLEEAKVGHGEAFQRLEAIAEPPELEPIRARLSTVEATNAGVRQNAERDRISAELDSNRTDSLVLTAAIDDVDSEKRAAIAGAELPVEGLSWTDDGVTFNGLPFEQASSAERLRASVGLAIAANPTLRVLLVREGSVLDEDGLRMLAEVAEAHGAQVWIEIVSEGGVGIIIEDGAIREAGVPDAPGAGASDPPDHSVKAD